MYEEWQIVRMEQDNDWVVILRRKGGLYLVLREVTSWTESIVKEFYVEREAGESK